MIFTTKKTTKMSWFSYFFDHMLPTWISVFSNNFKMWRDLISGNYDDYALLNDDDPFEECRDWFWTSLNEDEVYEKEFLEYLFTISDMVKTGEMKTVSYEEFMETLDLVDSVDK